MYWKHEAIENLKDYSAKKASIQNLTDEIKELTAKRGSIRSATSDGVAVKGGGSGREDAMINNIVRLDKLRENLHDAEQFIYRMDRGLEFLEIGEKELLVRFYITPERHAAEHFADELGVDVKTVYHRKDRALRKFTIAMYGCTES